MLSLALNARLEKLLGALPAPELDAQKAKAGNHRKRLSRRAGVGRRFLKLDVEELFWRFFWGDFCNFL